MNIVDLLVHQAAERPDAPAIVDAARTITFAELDRESRYLARTLANDGLEPGDVALVFCPMGVPLYVTLTGIFRLGLVAMFVDPAAGRQQIERSCAICPPTVFLGTPKAHLLRLSSTAIRRIPIHRFIGSRPAERLSSQTLQDPSHPCSADAPALLTFTTGSTGDPKAAIRTHGFLLAQHRALNAALQLEPGEIDLTTLPMFVLANLASGVTSLIPDADMRYPGRVDPQPILRQIRQHKPTRTVASPAFLSRLAAGCSARGETLDTLSRVFTGGGPVFPRVLDRLASAAPNARISAVYGSTEAEPIALVDRCDVGAPERRATRQGRGVLAGTPVKSVEVRIIADRWNTPLDAMSESQFQSLLRGPGEPGEIVVAGDHVLAGYVHGRGDRESKFSVDGRCWHRTGDAGYLDATGRLWLLGRCAAAVDGPIGRLYPFSVEAVAEEHPGVERAGLFADRGRRVLVVQLSASGTERTASELREDLAWAALDEIRIVEQIPVDARHNTKIDYARLKGVATTAA